MAVAPPSPSSAAGATTAPTSQSMDPQPSLKQQQPPPPPPQQSDAASSVTSSPDLSGRFSRSPGSSRDYLSLYTISRSEEYRQLFRLPPEEVLIQDFNCALQESILLQGHMYLFDHYLCFYANIFGFETKKIIPFNEIANVRRAKTAGIFPNAIEIFASGKKLFFASFLSRDEAFKLIAERWSLYGEGAKGISDEQDSKSESGSYLNGVNPLEDGNDELPASDLDSGERRLETSGSDDGDQPLNTEDDVAPPALSVQTFMEQCEELLVEEKVSTSDTSSNWMVEATDAPQISKSFTKVAESKFPIKVEEFFNLFFSDDAVGFVESFRKQCGDKDFKCTKWSTRDNLEIGREVSFQHPIKIYLGAKYGGCKELQTYRVYKNSHLVIRTSQDVNDVPYADYFHVEGCWDVCRDGDQCRESCILRVYVTVVFTKKTMFKGKIEQSTLDECREAFATWISLAHRLLRQKNIEKGQASVHKNETIRSESEGKVTEASARPCQRVEHRPIVNTGADCSGSTQKSETDTVLINTSDLASLFKILRTKFCSFLKSRGNLQLLLVATFVFILLLMQLSIVVLLTRPQPVHVSPQADHMATTGVVGSQSKAIATLLLEKRIHLFKDEMLLVEAHLERLKNEHMLLKAQLQDLEHQVRQM
ncbi:hypothetical protein Drorol1_Dr00005065 [Drosera rotundifolia]